MLISKNTAQKAFLFCGCGWGVTLGKRLGLQNNQMGKLRSLRNPPKFPPSLPPFPLTLDNPMAQWSQDSSDRCPLLCPAVFQVSQHRARSPGQRRL